MSEPLLLADLPDVLDDGTVLLRRLAAEDWTVEAALSADPDVVRWTTYRPDLDEAGARARVATAARRAAEGSGTRYALCPGGGAPVGTAGIAVQGRGAPEVFYALLPQGRGRGLATRATELLTGWALGAGHDVVLLLTMTGNAPSEAVARRAGFTPVAVEQVGDPAAPIALRRWERRA